MADDDQDAEIAAIAAINNVLLKLEEPEARRRVLEYVFARFLPDARIFGAGAHALSLRGVPSASGLGVPAIGSGAVGAGFHLVPTADKEIPGVARLTDAGDLKITARDLKAKSGLDAAVRLSHVAIYAYERLAGQAFSSRKGLTPLLKEWRLYDGNTRARLSKERGVIRSGDSLSLDAHARRDAERYVEEILSDELVGQWRPR